MMHIKGTDFSQLTVRVGAFTPGALCLTRLLAAGEAQRLLQNQAGPGERVAAGLRTLSQVRPPWWREGGENEIDADTLDMSDPLRTLLAQRFGSVKAGLEQLDLTEEGGVACGFIALDAQDAIQLRRLWLINLISSRVESRADRSAGAASEPPGRWHL
jgi:hypothetical protein